MTWRTALGVGLLLSCSGPLARITIEETASTTIEGGTVLEQLLDDFGFGNFLDMDITASEELANQGVGPGDIEDVYLIELTLEATDPPNADLTFIESIDVFVSAPDLPRVRVAFQSSFPQGQALVPFELEDVDLTDYVVSQSMSLETEVTGSRPNEDTTVEAGFALQLGVTSQGVCNQIRGNRGDTGAPEP